MGICGSKVEDVDEKGVDAKDTHDKTPTKPTKPAKDDRKETDEKEDASEVDFRETLKGVVLLILNRLVTALEYEQEGFHDLAVKRGKSNYMDLIAPQHFEKFLKETFDVESVTVSSPEVDTSDSNYEQQRFMRLLEACEKAPFRSPAPTSEKFATSIQKIAKLTQKELRESAISSDSSDLKIHLFFFAKALDVVDGGIVDHHELLYTNIDDMCEPKS